MGIVNLTEDSFSDGGRFLEATNAIEHALCLYAAGADIIDLGAASSHPSSRDVDAEEQIRRLQPVLEALLGRGLPISVDTNDAHVQEAVLGMGVELINDVDGLANPDGARSLASRPQARAIVMHRISGEHGRATTPSTMWRRIELFFEDRLRFLADAGIREHQLILDPGMGLFLGTSPVASLEMLVRLDDMRQRFGLPVLVSVSRKSFLQALVGRTAEATNAATLTAELWAANLGTDYIRTHDVAALSDALSVQSALAAQRSLGGVAPASVSEA